MNKHSGRIACRIHLDRRESYTQGTGLFQPPRFFSLMGGIGAGEKKLRRVTDVCRKPFEQIREMGKLTAIRTCQMWRHIEMPSSLSAVQDDIL
jgi:hypothetical protein